MVLYVADPTKIGGLIASMINVLLLILGLYMCYEGARAFSRIRAGIKAKATTGPA
jgi:predicted DNA repair protein MutK